MPLILALLSCIVLGLEVLETKVFAYSLENSLIFLIVGMVLLGFGAGGSVLALRGELGDPRPLVRKCLLWTAALLVLAHAWFAQFSHRLEFEFDFWTLSIVVFLSAPYFTAGMAIAAILAEPRGNVHARYGLNLLGSAAGCGTMFLMLGPLTGPQCLVAFAVAAALLAVPLCDRRARVAAIIALVGVPLLVFADAVLPYQIQKVPGGQLALIKANAANEVAKGAARSVEVREEFDRWDPTARVQVHSLVVDTADTNVEQALRDSPSMYFTQDSSYGSPLIGRGESPDGTRGVFERTCYGLGYFRGRPNPRVLVVGLGGAPDIQAALHHGAASITGVDINATTVAMVRDHMKDFLGDPYGDPRVSIHIRDGRSFIRTSPRRYDLIQLSGVDTKSVLASGTLALNESYLYTKEALREYLDHLEDDGLLCILYVGETFMHRLVNTVFEIIDERGPAEPARHVALIGQSRIFGLLVKPTPFTSEESSQLSAWVRQADAGDGEVDGLTGVVVLVYDLLNLDLSLANAPKPIYIPGLETEDRLINAELDGRRAELVANYRHRESGQLQDIRPAPDWRPFFFHTVANEQVWQTTPLYLRRAFNLLEIMSVLALVLILGPLLLMKRRGMQFWANLPFALYFACLGAGYIMAMSGLIQRYVLFLGHQAYAFAVVIGGLLLASGAGSFLAGRFEARPRRVMIGAVAGICTMLLAIQLALDPLFSWTADWAFGARVLLALAVIAPLGVPLGMLFPTGLAIVRKRSPMFVPWAFGVNGVFSVIGTSIVLPGALLYGFPAMAAAAGGAYVVALAVGLASCKT